MELVNMETSASVAWEILHSLSLAQTPVCAPKDPIVFRFSRISIYDTTFALSSQYQTLSSRIVRTKTILLSFGRVRAKNKGHNGWICCNRDGLWTGSFWKSKIVVSPQEQLTEFNFAGNFLDKFPQTLDLPIWSKSFLISFCKRKRHLNLFIVALIQHLTTRVIYALTSRINIYAHVQQKR